MKTGVKAIDHKNVFMSKRHSTYHEKGVKARLERAHGAADIVVHSVVRAHHNVVQRRERRRLGNGAVDAGRPSHSLGVRGRPRNAAVSKLVAAQGGHAAAEPAAEIRKGGRAEEGAGVAGPVVVGDGQALELRVEGPQLVLVAEQELLG